MKYSVSFAVGVSLTIAGFGYYLGSLSAELVAVAIGLISVAVAAALIYRFLWKHPSLTAFVWICGAVAMLFGISRLSEHQQIMAISWVPLLFILMMAFHSLTYPTLEQNEMSGIKTYYALEFKEVWKRTHVFYAVINTAFLPPTLFAALHGGYIFKVAFSSAMLLAPMFIAAYYSHIIGKRYAKNAEKEAIQERKREIENGWRGPNLKEK